MVSGGRTLVGAAAAGRSGGELRQPGPAGIKYLMPVIGSRNRHPNPALRAQARAVRRAQRLQRQFQPELVDYQGFQVDEVIGHPIDLVVGGGLIGGAVRVGEQFGQRKVDRMGELFEAS